MNRKSESLKSASKKFQKKIGINEEKYKTKIMISKITKTIGNQRYEYKPRYYNPDKEALAERMDMRKRAKAGEKDAIKARMRDSMRRQKDRKVNSKILVQSNIIVMVVFAFLLILVLVGLNSYLPEVMEVMLGR